MNKQTYNFLMYRLNWILKSTLPELQKISKKNKSGETLGIKYEIESLCEMMQRKLKEVKDD